MDASSSVGKRQAGVEAAADSGPLAGKVFAPRLAPGNPGVPSEPSVIYAEDFEHVPGTDSVLRLTEYEGASGQRYTADQAWLEYCNGWIASATQSTTAAEQIEDCHRDVTGAGGEGSWNTTQQLAHAFGQYVGATDPATNHAVSAYTAADPGADQVEFETDGNIPFTSSNRFVTFGVDVAAVSCEFAPALLQFNLLDDTGDATPVGSVIDGCASETTVNVPALGVAGARAVQVGTYTSDGAILFNGSSIGVRMLNQQASGIGNDHAFDNIRILDVTPQLDKEFEPTSVPVNATSTLTLTVTNTAELAAKDGWAFTDELAEGLVVADPANIGGTCVADVTAPAGGDSIAVVNGSLAAGSEYCTITVDVTSEEIGEYRNGPENITGETGIDPPGDSTIAFHGLDFGDAPDSYGTTLAVDGARHAIVDYDETANAASVMLGASVDPENDGQPSASADGDDTTGVADEDGVTFNPALGYENPTIRTGLDPQSLQPIENTLEIEASADGFVSVWVDWNQDGEFADDERVANAQAVTAGSNEVTFEQGVNPAEIDSYVRVRYSTDAASIATPTGAAPDGEVEDYRVLFERLVTPDACTTSGALYYAIAFDAPVDATGTGGVGSTARYENVTVVDGVAVDMLVETVAGTMNSSVAQPNGFTVGNGGVIGDDDAQWQINRDATVQYRFVEAGTETAVGVNAAFTVSDMDTSEVATFDAADLAAYAVSQGSAVEIAENDGQVVFTGNGNWNGDPESRFQFVLEGLSEFEVRWQGGVNSGFGFDGDGDLAIDPACFDMGDAPASYGTLMEDDGARHTIVPGVYLGELIDVDPDGQPSNDALGDDENRLADEDGVTFNPALGYENPTIRTGLDPDSLQPLQNTLEIEASVDGFVSVWVDWNQDGAFTDDERVANAQAVTAGVNEVTFEQGVNPAEIDSYVRVRYSTDAASIATPTGAAPDGEVEDYRVFFERLVTPDTCVDLGVGYHAFTFTDMVDQVGSGGVGSSTRFLNVTVVDGVAVDMVATVESGALNPSALAPPNGFGVSGDDVRWQLSTGTGVRSADVRYSFVEAGTNTPVSVNGVFTAMDMDGPPEINPGERLTFSADDLAAYAVTEGSAVQIAEDGGDVTFSGHGNWNNDPESRFQFVLEGIESFLVRSEGGSGSAFQFDGNGDYSIDPPACSDFGDAPASYGTLLADDGARHQIVPGLTLGELIDFDPDGQPTDDALGDDNNRIADEDGVVDPIVVNVGAETTVTVSATNDTDEVATLAGWIDLDGNGTFDAGELVTVEVPANSGAADYELTFPAGTVTADTYARFRLFPGSVTDPLPTGPATGGEVEDYTVTVQDRELEIEKSSDMTENSRPGDTVTYTVTATNTGSGDFTDAFPAVVLDDLAGVLDDASYNSDATAEISDGSDAAAPSFVAPSFVSWSGQLAAGETVTITYTVTLEAGGDGTLRNVAWEPETPPVPGTPPTDVPTCDPRTADGTDPVTGEACGFTEHPLPKLTIEKISDMTDLPADGGEVTYTVTVTNVGPGVYTEDAPANMTDDLTEVLDDGTFGEILSPTDGSAALDGNELVWSGPLSVDESIEVRYTVVYDADAVEGDHVLLNTACIAPEAALDPDAACDLVRVPAAALVMDKMVDPADGTAVVAGQDVTYTLTFENVGEAVAAVDALDTLAGVLDDATLVDGPNADTGLVANLVGDQLSITGEVPVGETLAVTYTVTVNEYADQTDHVLGNVLGLPDGCPPGGCISTENPIPHLSVTKSADPTEDVVAGDTVTYTITIENDGEADYTAENPADVRDDMTDVLDDATYNGDASAEGPEGVQVPQPEFESPYLNWSGALAVGEQVTISYTVTVTNLGDHNLVNSAGIVCESPEICDPPTNVEVPLPSIVPAKASDPASGTAVDAGDVVTYTLSWTNSGEAAGRVDSTDDLSNVLDDGELTSGPVVDAEFAETISAEFDAEAGAIRVEGVLAPGETVNVTYQVTIGADGQRGDNIAGNVLTPDVPPFVPPADCETDCQPPFVPPTTEHPIGELIDSKSVDPESGTAVDAGQQVTYTLTYENIGEAPESLDSVDDLSGVLDDATLVEGSIVTSNDALTATLDGDQLSITGDVPPGARYTVSYTVTVNGWAQQGDHVLANALQCAAGAPEDCEPETTENPIRHFTVTKQLSEETPSPVQTGDVVTYTISVTNDGEAGYTEESPASIIDDMSDVLDDATYNGDAVALDHGGDQVNAPVFSDQNLSWTGALAAGETVTITYSVTVTNLGDHDLVNVASPVCEDGVICDPPTPPVEVLLPSIIPSKSSDPTSGEGVNAGDVITYTLSWTNDGQAPGDVDSTDDLSDVLDDAVITSDPVADLQGIAVELDLEAQTIRVAGELAPGATMTVTYQATVLPDGERGNNIAGNVLTPAVPPFEPPADCDPAECPPPFVPPATEHPIGELDDWKTVDPASGSTVQPGQRMTYTLTFENIGEAAVDVNRDDVLTQVLDDATVSSAPISSDPALSVSEIIDGRFTVSGSLEPGQLATVTYTVTVNPDGERGDDRLGNFLVDTGEEPPETCEPVEGERPDCTVNHVSNVVPTKSADPDSGTNVAQGERVTYTLTFQNVSANPEAEPAAIDYTDHLVDVLDDATMANAPESSDESVTAVRLGDTIRITGAVASGDTVTVSYSVTVNAYDQQGDHHLGNVIAVTGEEPICVQDSILCTSHSLTPPPPLAVTGGQIAWVAVIAALGLIVLGGGALLVARQRRTAGAPTHGSEAI